MDFSIRSDRTELLDQQDIPAKDIQQNMHELGIINQLLGGHVITWQGFHQLVKTEPVVYVCEIGCGGGDNLKTIEKRLTGRKTKVSFTGIDINADCIRMAENMKWKRPAHFIVSDYKKVEFEKKPDIIFSSLFCHHFKEAELIDMFRWMKSNCRSGFFINDLHRHPLAYYSIRFLTSLFSRSYLVKHDAPVSVLRGFRKKELKNILLNAGISHFSIQWRWAFRWLVIVRN
jgi:2-polyprenyl-3-methyl-5-hydroxy-6-metoxy-1,4-benzoquinol methylase